MRNKKKKITDSASLRKSSKKNILNLLLSNKKLLSANSKNLSKNVNDTDETDFTFLKKNPNNELPILQSSKILSSIENSNGPNFGDRNKSNQRCLNDLLFNSMSFENFLKDVISNHQFNNPKDTLPPISPEERKNFFDENNSSLNINNSSKISNHKSTLSNNKNINKFKKNYMFCLQKYDEFDSNKNRIVISASHKYFKEKIDINKLLNIPRNVLFRQIILNEASYSNFYYDNNEYIMEAKYYNNFIKSNIKQLKNNIPQEEQFHRILEKEYLESNYNNPKLILNSLSISFTRKGKFHLFHIPFELLPIVYYKNMSYLKYFLINIVRFDDNYEDITLDYDEVNNILCHSKQFEFEGDNTENTNKFFQKQILLKSTKTINRKTFHNLTMNFGKFMSKHITSKEGQPKVTRSIKKNKTIKVFNGVQVDPEAYINNQKEEINIYKCPYNKFNFKWNTPKYEYEVEVKTPEAIFQIDKTSLRAYIDIEYIFNFLINDFENWDYYISQFIFSYKECQYYLSSFLSLKNRNTISLKRSPSQPLFNYINNANINKTENNSNNNRNIFLNMEKTKIISEKSKNYEFICTDENCSNYIKILHNFFITARCKSFKNKGKFQFDFNFFQMKILNNIAKIQGLNYFIKKLIIIDKISSNLNFGYDELNTMAKGSYKLLEKQKPNIDASQTCLRMKEIYKDIINITITFPFLETIRYDNQNYNNCFETDYNNVIVNGLPFEILDELCNNNFSEWSKILMKIKL